ncbi:MAG: Abi family protein [Prolixibacteraceae bacterium]|nr:Abi family protein [Prolixibacteraceae bacterium]
MTKVPYTKPALSYADQLQQVKSRGLIIPDEKEFLRLLELKSYYRLSGYWYPLLADKQNHIFKPGASFETAWQMYQFDRDLRQLVINEMEKVEIAVRAKMIYILAHSFGAFWHTNPALFSDKALHTKTLYKIDEEFNRSDAQFVRAFKKKYSDPLPPCWTAFEIISFGSLSMLFDNLKPGRSKREVANWFGLDDKTFASWIHSLVYIRNVCAHHSRLWNRELRIQPRYPVTPDKQWLKNQKVDNRKVYYVLSMLLYLLQTLDNGHSLTEDFSLLLQKYPNIDPAAMGFPSSWATEPLWVRP